MNGGRRGRPRSLAGYASDVCSIECSNALLKRHRLGIFSHGEGKGATCYNGRRDREVRCEGLCMAEKDHLVLVLGASCTADQHCGPADE